MRLAFNLVIALVIGIAVLSLMGLMLESQVNTGVSKLTGFLP